MPDLSEKSSTKHLPKPEEPLQSCWPDPVTTAWTFWPTQKKGTIQYLVPLDLLRFPVLEYK